MLWLLRRGSDKDHCDYPWGLLNRVARYDAWLVLLTLNTNVLYVFQIHFTDFLLVMRQLIDFIYSKKQLQLDFARGVYRSVITAMGGQTCSPIWSITQSIQTFGH